MYSIMEDKMNEHVSWIEQTLAEESLRPVEERFPHVPEAQILDEHGTVGPEINPQRRDAPQDPREGTNDDF